MLEAIFITYSFIVSTACACVWIGSKLSLSEAQSETMSKKDAYMFPLIGSATLFGLYMLFKYLNKELVNLLLSSYFLLFGLTALLLSLLPILSLVLPSSSKRRLTLKIPYFPIDWPLSSAHLASAALSLLVCAWYALTKHWVANNVLATAFAIQGIASLSVGSFQAGSILLCGLFFYDIFWVFGTEVMVSVAKNFDAPIKLVFPRDIFASVYQFSMLGLGDIVIPGVFVALLLRFDRSLSSNKKSFPTPYFLACYVFYCLGLLSTIFVMHFFKAAQPALLYLVPACLIASFGTAILKGQLSLLLAYDEGEDAKAKQAQEEQKKK